MRINDKNDLNLKWNAIKPVAVTADGDIDTTSSAANKANTTQSSTTGKASTIKPSTAVTAATGVSTASTGTGAAATADNTNPNQSYIDQLTSLYDQIMNRGSFNYDLNGDMLYRQMADQYTQLGRQAMRDAIGQSAALTGGYGNSYANVAGSQAYQNYLTQLNEAIPSLYDRAYEAWQDEGDDLVDQYNMVLTQKENIDALTPEEETVVTYSSTPTLSKGTYDASSGAVAGAMSGVTGAAKTTAVPTTSGATAGITAGAVNGGTGKTTADNYYDAVKNWLKKRSL